MPSYQDYFNERTGEQATGMLVLKRMRYPKGIKFTTLFDHGLIHLAKSKQSAADLKVLLALIGIMEFGNWVSMSQKTIAHLLGLTPSNISASIRRLCDQGLVARLPDPSDIGRKALRISLDIAWRGTPKDWTDAINAGEGIVFAPISVPAELFKRTAKHH